MQNSICQASTVYPESKETKTSVTLSIKVKMCSEKKERSVIELNVYVQQTTKTHKQDCTYPPHQQREERQIIAVLVSSSMMVQLMSAEMLELFMSVHLK